MRRLSIVLLLLLASCLNIDDCFMARGTFSNFKITGQVPDFNLAFGDSVTIDMSNYWQGDIGCSEQSYIPQVLSAESASNLYELRTVGKYLIVKGKNTGSSSISAYAERKYVSDHCDGSTKSQPIEFNVTVGGSTNENFEKTIEGDIGNWIIEVKAEPRTFGIGDTVLVHAVAQDTAIKDEDGHWKYEYTWLTNSSARILTSDWWDPCSAGVEESSTNSVLVVVEDSSQVIQGFVHVQNGNGTELRNGLAFKISSK